MNSVAIITTYHFNSKSLEAYSRLVLGLRSIIRQLSADDRLILVANGNSDSVEDPDKVVKDVDPPHPKCVERVVMQENAGIAAGLNVGIEAARRLKKDWIGQIQSSVVVGALWLDAMRQKADSTNVSGLFGRLVYEDLPDTIWADGHYLCKGQTWNGSYEKPAEVGAPSMQWMFPCLSATVFPARVVELVCERYGNFVSERLARYGDCTDVALRCASINGRTFGYVPAAVGKKRRPTLQRGEIACSQLLAARRFYNNRLGDAEARLVKNPRYAQFVVDALKRSADLDAQAYSPKGVASPQVSEAEDAGMKVAWFVADEAQ